MAGPDGRFATTSTAAGAVSRRRANHPGNGSMELRADSDISRSNMSKYLRSITGQL